MFFMTKAGRHRLGQKIVQLENRLAEVLREKGVAAEVGGNEWHDNFAFEQCEREERMLQWRINELRTCLSQTVIVEPSAESKKVQIGSAVEIEFDDGTEMTLTIGGHLDSAPEAGIVAYDTPLGQALLDAEVGEERAYTVGKNRLIVTVRSIRV